MKMDNTTMIVAFLTGFNTLLVAIVGSLIKHELHDIKERIVRMENVYFPAKGDL
jgi:hypothetical protein